MPDRKQRYVRPDTAEAGLFGAQSGLSARTPLETVSRRPQGAGVTTIVRATGKTKRTAHRWRDRLRIGLSRPRQRRRAVFDMSNEKQETAVGLIAVITAVFALLATPAFAANVGFERTKIANGTEAPLTIGVWYPTDAPETEQRLGDIAQNVAPRAAVAGRNLPLVVLSHGGGGGYESHYDTALALAKAGFVVAAVSHAGDTYNDQSQVLKLWRRPAQLRRLVSYMLDEWSHHDQLDGRRVGAFGFSNGGFTVLVAAGGILDLGKTGPYCLAHPIMTSARH